MKMAALALMVAVMCVPAKAQGFFNRDIFKWSASKLEVGGGYTYVSLVQVDGTHRLNMNGFNAIGEYRAVKWISLAVDLSGTYNSSHATQTRPSNGKTQLYNMYIGPRFYPLGHNHKLTPYGHFLFGAAIYGNNIPAAGGFDSYSYWDHTFSWMAGGGLDLKWKKRWAIRLIDVDWEHTKFFNQSTGQGNYRASVGIIYKFGQK
jgi:Outer membrane protein beta-barrel domain